MSSRSFCPSNSIYGSVCLRASMLFILLILSGAHQAHAALPLPQAQTDSETMDNDLVIRMVREKMSTSVIVNAIRTNPGHYSLTPNGLLHLNAAGVPAAVIEAMQARAGSAPAIASAVAPATSQWITANRNDPMTGDLSVEATRAFPLSGGASVNVTASCHIDALAKAYGDAPAAQARMWQGLLNAVATNDDAPQLKAPENHVDARTLELSFQYLPAPGSNVSVHLSPTAQTVTSYGNSNVGVASPSSYCAVMRVMVDDAGRSGVGSGICNLPNRASVSFLAARQRDLVGAGMQRGDDDSPAGKLAGALMNGISDATDTSVALMQNALAAQQIRVELPLDDGNTALIAVHPQESSFLQFTAACLAAFPAPPTKELVIPPGGPFGIKVQQTTLNLRSRSLPGLQVMHVYVGGPAYLSQIHDGDVITVVNGQPVASERDILKALQSRSSRLVSVTAYRDGFIQGFEVHPNRFPASAATRPISNPASPASAALPEVASLTSTPGLKGMAIPLDGAIPIRLPSGRPRPGAKTGAEALAALDNSLWIADGPPSDKQIYVVAGPCCGYSQALYHATRDLQGVQLRWVEMAPTPKPKCLGYLGEIAAASSSNPLSDMYDTLADPLPAPQALQENAIRWNGGVEGAITYLVNTVDPGHSDGFQYPTLVWVSKEGVRAAIRPDNIAAIVASVVPRPEATNIAPLGRTYVNASYSYQSMPSKAYLAKQDGTGMYAFPDTKSQLIYTLEKDKGYYASHRLVVAGVPWIEYSLYGHGEPGPFVREAEVYPAK
jgi:hypothetical protein